jgi:hypothetical protein
LPRILPTAAAAVALGAWRRLDNNNNNNNNNNNHNHNALAPPGEIEKKKKKKKKTETDTASQSLDNRASCPLYFISFPFNLSRNLSRTIPDSATPARRAPTRRIRTAEPLEEPSDDKANVGPSRRAKLGRACPVSTSAYRQTSKPLDLDEHA